MKNRVLSFIVVLALIFTMMPVMVFAAGTGVKIADAFPDANFRAYVQEKIDTDGNGYLSYSEIAAVTYIIVGYRGIKTIKGVELFTNLEDLFCEDNQITKLDVSKNTALKRFHCNGNQLTYLDVSKNTVLDELFCYKNQLTSLDVSKCTNLSYVDYSENPIYYCDLSKNKKLSYTVISPDIDVVVHKDGTKSVDLNVVYQHVSLPSGYDLSESTSVENYLKAGFNVSEVEFDPNTLVVSWGKSKPVYRVVGCWNRESQCKLEIYVNTVDEDSYTITKPIVTKTNDPISGKPKLTWRNVYRASKYEVYRYDSAKKTYVKMYTTTNTNYTNTSAEAGKTYYYKVKAISSSLSAKSSITDSIKVTCKYPAPKIIGTHDPNTGKNKLTWAKVPGATKYEIYRYDSAKKTYVKMHTTTNTSYTNTTAVAGYTYWYRVKALGSVSAATSAFSSYAELTCKYATPQVTGGNDASSGKCKLTWKKVDGATKYEIYRYDSAKKTYVKMYTTANTSYINTTAAAGKTYYYKIRAIGTKAAAASNYSDSVKVTCK